MTRPRPNLAWLACALGMLVPGAGHVLLGRRDRGLIFFACLTALFLLGVAMDARLAAYLGLDDPLAVLRSGAQMAIGLPYPIARLLGLGLGEMTAPSYEYGNTFTEVCGLLNILVVMDAYDTAMGRRG